MKTCRIKSEHDITIFCFRWTLNDNQNAVFCKCFAWKCFFFYNVIMFNKTNKTKQKQNNQQYFWQIFKITVENYTWNKKQKIIKKSPHKWIHKNNQLTPSNINIVNWVIDCFIHAPNLMLQNFIHINLFLQNYMLWRNDLTTLI